MGISTHILDTALGRPAAQVPVTLAFMENGAWSPISEAVTDADGRCKHLSPPLNPYRPASTVSTSRPPSTSNEIDCKDSILI